MARAMVVGPMSYIQMAESLESIADNQLAPFSPAAATKVREIAAVLRSGGPSHLIDLLQDVAEFLEPYVDVMDGSDGPRPNEARSLSTRLGDEIMRLKSHVGPLDRNAILEEAAKVCDDCPRDGEEAAICARDIRALKRSSATPQNEGKP